MACAMERSNIVSMAMFDRVSSANIMVALAVEGCGVCMQRYGKVQVQLHRISLYFIGFR
jgi:hypothetical protein